MSDIKYEIIKIIESIIEQKIGLFDPNLNIFNNLGFNSLKLITLLLTLEKQFNIKIEENDFDYNKIDTLENIYNFIAEKINN